MRIPLFLVQPAVVASLAIHGGLAVVAAHFGGPTVVASVTERTTQVFDRLRALDAEVPAEAVDPSDPARRRSTRRHRPRTTSTFCPEPEVIEFDPTPVEVPELPPDESIVAFARAFVPIALRP